MNHSTGSGKPEVLHVQLLVGRREVRTGGDAGSTTGIDIALRERAREQEVSVPRESPAEHRAEIRQRAVLLPAAQQELVRPKRPCGHDHYAGFDMARLPGRGRLGIQAVEGDAVAAAR